MLIRSGYHEYHPKHVANAALLKRQRVYESNASNLQRQHHRFADRAQTAEEVLPSPRRADCCVLASYSLTETAPLA
jgi:hypothetical protein